MSQPIELLRQLIESRVYVAKALARSCSFRMRTFVSRFQAPILIRSALARIFAMRRLRSEFATFFFACALLMLLCTRRTFICGFRPWLRGCVRQILLTELGLKPRVLLPHVVAGVFAHIGAPAVSKRIILVIAPRLARSVGALVRVASTVIMIGKGLIAIGPAFVADPRRTAMNAIATVSGFFRQGVVAPMGFGGLLVLAGSDDAVEPFAERDARLMRNIAPGLVRLWTKAS